MVLYWYNFSVHGAIIDSVVSNGLLVLICLLLNTMFRFYLPNRERYMYLTALLIALTVAWIFISRSLLFLVEVDVADYSSFFAVSFPVRFAFGFLILGSFILLSVLWHTWNDQQDIERRQTEAQRLANEAELYSLRQQLQPHFLFNSLNSINALIGVSQEEARNMIQKLSDFLRGTLKKDGQQLTTVEEELNHLRLYLDIEKVRFGHRLNTVVKCDEPCAKMKIPSLLLQPVVENAIKFGLYNTTGAITITINVECADNKLIIKVVNPYDASFVSVKRGTGFGLTSVQRRLFLVYAQHGLLQTIADSDLFTTIIFVPQIND